MTSTNNVNQVTMEKRVLTLAMYEMACKMANKYAYGNTRSIMYDQYLSVALDGLNKALETYKEGADILFTTYAYRCINNALINEKKRSALHNLDEQDGYDLSKYDGKTEELKDDNFVNVLKMVIKKAVKNDERNAMIYERYIGLDCDREDLKDIASALGLTHERVRVIVRKTERAISKDKEDRELLYGFVG